MSLAEAMPPPPLLDTQADHAPLPITSSSPPQELCTMSLSEALERRLLHDTSLPAQFRPHEEVILQLLLDVARVSFAVATYVDSNRGRA